jgi:hypothetical protein
MGARNMAMVEAEAPDARRAPRFRVLLVARLLTTSGERNVKLRDISANGAMIEGDRLPATGTDVMLRRGSLELIATIVWAKDGKAGLEFDEPLTEAELWMQVNAPHLAEVETEPAPIPAVPDPLAAFNRSFSRQ